MGIHRSMRGLCERYMHERQSGAKRARSSGDFASHMHNLEHHGMQALLDVFRGRGVGVEELEADDLVPRTPTGRVVPGGAASGDLGNSEHCDVSDATQGWACWVVHADRSEGRFDEPAAWWLLFPAIGLAVRLVHGVFVSWAGKWISHCTCVPQRVEGVQLLSLWGGYQRGVFDVMHAQAEFSDVVAARASGAFGACLPLTEGDNVWVRMVTGAHGEWRRMSGVVAAAGEGEEGLVVSCGSAHDVVIVPEDEIEARVVRAGAITRASERRGKAIVGCRVRVYWPEEDACFDGTVRGFDGCAHAVEYDDGDAFDELFGGEDTPHWRVLP